MLCFIILNKFSGLVPADELIIRRFLFICSQYWMPEQIFVIEIMRVEKGGLVVARVPRRLMTKILDISLLFFWHSVLMRICSCNRKYQCNLV